MGRNVVAAVFLMSAVLTAHAQDWTEDARMLGMLMASERLCGLSYGPDTVSGFVGAHAEPGRTLDFIDTMNAHASDTERSLSAMDESQKVAHCEEARRIATDKGFIQ